MTSSSAMLIAMRDATAVTLGCALLALGVNALRPGGIPLVQAQPYDILVPCPESVAEVESIRTTDARVQDAGTLLVDARADPRPSASLPRVMRVPYDYLEPTPPEVIARIAASGARQVVVFGDGLDPDTGRELARELAAKGIRNVLHLEGGAAAVPAATGGREAAPGRFATEGATMTPAAGAGGGAP